MHPTRLLPGLVLPGFGHGTKPPTAAEQKPTEMGSKDDFQLQQALAFLKGQPVKQQAPTIAQQQPATTASKPN